MSTRKPKAHVTGSKSQGYQVVIPFADEPEQSAIGQLYFTQYREAQNIANAINATAEGRVCK